MIFINKQIKATLGITGLFCLGVLICDKDWHLDVGSSHPVGRINLQGSVCSPVKAIR